MELKRCGYFGPQKVLGMYYEDNEFECEPKVQRFREIMERGQELRNEWAAEDLVLGICEHHPVVSSGRTLPKEILINNLAPLLPEPVAEWDPLPWDLRCIS